MSAAKHTSGPWCVDPSDKTAVFKQFKLPRIVNEKVCSVRFSWMTQGEKEANARLIAAAPDLLEALKGMLSVYGITQADYEFRGIGSQVEVDLAEQARAAIAKATGGAA